MKLETFFEKFDQFTDAPDAVEKMRELPDWQCGKLVLTPGRTGQRNVASRHLQLKLRILP